MKAAVLRTLHAIDWDFASPRAGYVPPPHWYPGTFVPALSHAVIEALTPSGGLVFDPYAGIGTTGWSALRTGRNCHLADVNRVAILVAYTTNTLLALVRSHRNQTNAILGDLSRLVGRNDDLFGIGTSPIGAEKIDSLVETVCSPSAQTLCDELIAGPPQWQLLAQWIAPETLEELSALTDAIISTESAYLRLLGLSMISAIARSVSSQHASWGHIADNVRPRTITRQDIGAAIARWLKRTKGFTNFQMTQVSGESSPLANVHVRDWSMPGAIGHGDADLLLTSPPYADAIDYTLAQRLSLYLLGYDDPAILKLVSTEIGARRKRFKSVSRVEWSQQLCTALKEQVTWVKKAGAICLVLPHKESGRSEGEEELKATLDGLGWKLVFEKDRSIHQSHTRQSWTSIKKETILAFARD